MLTVQQDTASLKGSKKLFETDDEKWNAVLARDEGADGLFVLGVQSTGIYCRPSCPARRPARQHVTFFDGADLAEKAGFRACLRCLPREAKSPRTIVIERICRYIQNNLDKNLTLQNLASQVGLSAHHLQRTFKRVLGVSPRQYIETRRLEKMKGSLRNGATVNNALYNAGFSSRSRVYETGVDQLGVNPGTVRRGGEGLRIDYTIVDSPLGRLLLGSTPRGLCAVCIGDSDLEVENSMVEDYPLAKHYRNDTAMKRWADTFLQYFKGEEFPRQLPLDIRATAFQSRVWKELQNIPLGETRSYTEVADAIGTPAAVRAVANACATNPVALIVPCHRVIGKDGTLHGYYWGLKRKEALLKLEKAKTMVL
jgi:AraC family transcriptional regulator of adaptative response/methylated-DNA-[protein]-cysteine methyltransferase